MLQGQEKNGSLAMLIGELARRTGVPRDTIRYYEKLGLLRKPERLENNYKAYGEEHERRLKYIVDMKALGFTLSVIRMQLQTFADTPVTCGAVAPGVREKIAEIDRRIEMLQARKVRIATFFQPCTGSGAEDICRPITRLLD
jgi:DNA-binding transcriptional MerR regulator